VTGSRCSRRKAISPCRDQESSLISNHLTVGVDFSQAPFQYHQVMFYSAIIRYFFKLSYLAFVTVPLVAMLVAGCDSTRFRVRTPPGTQVDVFEQTSVPRIDVLWVVDNSASMSEEQQALAENFDHFFVYLESSGADYHIGVTSTDIYNPEHQGHLLGEVPIISRATPNAKAVFAADVNVGTEGKGDEQGLATALLALSEPLISGANKGFLRDDAYLFVIFVSDEDDHSFGEPGYFVRRFEQIKGIGNDGMSKAAAVVGDVPEVPAWCRESKNAEPGVRYSEVATETGGLSLSICSDDFAGNLDKLGFSAAGLKRYFTLSQAPIPATLAVWVKTSCAAEPMPRDVCAEFYDDCGGAAEDVYGATCILSQALPDGWSYEEESNSIRFYGRALPPFAAVIEVGYIPEES
jgi:hypothetical protein